MVAKTWELDLYFDRYAVLYSANKRGAEFRAYFYAKTERAADGTDIAFFRKENGRATQDPNEAQVFFQGRVSATGAVHVTFDSMIDVTAKKDFDNVTELLKMVYADATMRVKKCLRKK